MNEADREWSRFALVVIDLQHDFWPAPLAAQFPDLPANLERLLARCRAEGVEVVHVRSSFRTDSTDWMVAARLRGFAPCVEGTPGAKPLPFAREAPGETVVVKQTYDAFQSGELAAHLRAGGKRFVLTAGLLTSVCVLFSTASAAQQGFLAAVVEDCCAAGREAHEQALRRYSGLLFDRTTVDALAEHHRAWIANLELLDECERTGRPPDPRRVVAAGYDRIAERYLRWSEHEVVDAPRARYLDVLLESLQAGARLLELGCGGGGTVTRRLAERFELTGVDISARQVELAVRNVPGATFVHGDYTRLDFPAASFDAVAAFYAFTHLPPGELPRVLGRIVTWLRPGGLLVATMPSRRTGAPIDPNWLGAPMYFSGYAEAESRRFVEEAGLRIESARVETPERRTTRRHDQEFERHSFLWVIATKPDG
jgi:nicotinamidase-related amidase/SAM-dependent methyltransferase